jgi:hypothetical protein
MPVGDASWRFSGVGVIQLSLDSEFENWFGDLFYTLCIRDLEIINGDTTVLDLFVGYAYRICCAINSRLRDGRPSASAVDNDFNNYIVNLFFFILPD